MNKAPTDVLVDTEKITIVIDGGARTLIVSNVTQDWPAKADPASLGLPQPGLNHPASQCLCAARVAVLLHQVLARQRGTKVAIVLAYNAHKLVLHRLQYPSVTGYSPSLGYSALSAVLAYRTRQPFDLAHGYV